MKVIGYLGRDGLDLSRAPVGFLRPEPGEVLLIAQMFDGNKVGRSLFQSLCFSVVEHDSPLTLLSNGLTQFRLFKSNIHRPLPIYD